MAAALRLSYSVLKATTSDTSALKVNLINGGLPAAAVTVGLQLGALGRENAGAHRDGALKRRGA